MPSKNAIERFRSLTARLTKICLCMAAHCNRAGSAAGRQAHGAEARGGLAVAEVLELEELAHLDLAHAAVDRGVGKAARPLERLFARAGLDDRVAGDQFPRLGERAVDHAALRAVVAHAPPFRARLQSRGIEQHAS